MTMSADQPAQFRIEEQSKETGVDQELREKINFARQLMRDRNYEGATALLELLYESDTDNQVIINLLKQCYDQQQYFEKSEELVRRQTKLHPENLSYWTSLGEAVARQGKKDEAVRYYREAKSKINTANQIRFQVIIQSMLTHDLEREAEVFIDEWRTEYHDTTLLGMQMGMIHELHKEYIEAVQEYYPILSDTSRSGNDVEKKIQNLLNFTDSAPEVEAFLLSQADLYTNQRGVKILSTYYLQTGAFDKAFEFTKTRDSLEQLSGNSLISYMKSCNLRKLYSETIRMGDYLLNKYSDQDTKNSAQFIYAEALTKLGRYEDALAVYDSIFATSDNRVDKSDALYFAGVLYQDLLFDIPKALTYFDSVCTKYQYGFSYMNSLLARPYCYLQAGDIKNAKAGYEQLGSRRMHDDAKEKISYYTGLVYFLDKQVDSSRLQMSKLIIDYPRGFYVNDALELMKIIDEGKESEQVLYDYSNAIFFELQRKYDSVFQKLELIAKNESTVLADFALFKLIQFSSDFGDTAKTIAFVDTLSEKFPESYYMPFGLKKKADIYILDEDKTEEAVALYKLLLEKHTNYPFISEIREKLRALADKKSA